MMRARVLREVALTTFREFVRTPEALFWTYGFPLIMAVVLGLAFASGRPAPVPVAVTGDARAELVAALAREPRLVLQELAPAEAGQALARGKVDILVAGTPEAPALRLDPTRSEAEPARLLVERALHRAGGRLQPMQIDVQEETAPGSRYIDFLIPGLVAMNLLGSGLFGVGFSLVQMRVRKLLRLLIVAPMGRAEFLTAYLLSRLVLVLPESLAIVGFGHLMFGVPCSGGLLALLLLVLLGGCMFLGLGLLVGSRARTLEAVGGLMNALMVPMWLLGGVFFSSERFPEFVQPLIQLLPITHLCDALREVMLEGAGLWDVSGQLAILAGFTLLFFGAALKLFRWA